MGESGDTSTLHVLEVGDADQIGPGVLEALTSIHSGKYRLNAIR